MLQRTVQNTEQEEREREKSPAGNDVIQAMFAPRVHNGNWGTDPKTKIKNLNNPAQNWDIQLWIFWSLGRAWAGDPSKPLQLALFVRNTCRKYITGFNRLTGKVFFVDLPKFPFKSNFQNKSTFLDLALVMIFCGILLSESGLTCWLRI